MVLISIQKLLWPPLYQSHWLGMRIRGNHYVIYLVKNLGNVPRCIKHWTRLLSVPISTRELTSRKLSGQPLPRSDNSEEEGKGIWKYTSSELMRRTFQDGGVVGVGITFPSRRSEDLQNHCSCSLELSTLNSFLSPFSKHSCSFSLVPGMLLGTGWQQWTHTQESPVELTVYWVRQEGNNWLHKYTSVSHDTDYREK